MRRHGRQTAPNLTRSARDGSRLRTRPRSSGIKSAQDEQCLAADAIISCQTEKLLLFLNKLVLAFWARQGTDWLLIERSGGIGRGDALQIYSFVPNRVSRGLERLTESDAAEKACTVHGSYSRIRNAVGG